MVRFGSVLFAGCFLKSNEAKDLGFTGAADLRAWPASVRRVQVKYGRMTIVPGHGSVECKCGRCSPLCGRGAKPVEHTTGDGCPSADTVKHPLQRLRLRGSMLPTLQG